jgi:hypothetical protein
MATGAHTLGGLAPRRGGSARRVLILAAAALLAVAAAAAWRLRVEDERRQVPSPAITIPAAARDVQTPRVFRAAIADGLLSLVNEGAAGVSDLRVTVYDQHGTAHEATAEGVLAPGEEVLLPLDAFVPALPAAVRPRRVSVQPAGGPAQDAPLR